MVDYSRVNRCYRNGPCLFGDPERVSREDHWDYYDSSRRAYVHLDCRIHNKHYAVSPVEIENEESYLSGLSAREHPDLQLHDTDGVWWTCSNDPESFHYDFLKEDVEKRCADCDILCQIRDWEKYLDPGGSCPYPDPPPQPIYRKVVYDGPCDNFLHPLLLQDVDAINRKRRRVAKAHIWKYLKEPKWMHALINSGQPMMQVWRRNYRPAQVYFSSFETVKLYLKTMPEHMRRNPRLVERVRENLEKSPSTRKLLRESWHEEDLKGEMDRYIDGLVKEKGRRPRR